MEFCDWWVTIVGSAGSLDFQPMWTQPGRYQRVDWVRVIEMQEDTSHNPC